MPFKYKSHPKRAKPLGMPAWRVEKQEEVIVPVQGQMPDSVEELRLARALDKYKIEYKFQVDILGGHRVRGGFVLDFLVFTPRPVPISVEGSYWHKGSRIQQDQLLFQILRNKYGTIPIVVKSDELDTQENADKWVVENVI